MAEQFWWEWCYSASENQHGHSWPFSPCMYSYCLFFLWRSYSWHVLFASPTRRPFGPNLDWYHIPSVSLRHPRLCGLLHHAFLLVSFQFLFWFCVYSLHTLSFHSVRAHRYWLWYTTQKIVCGSVRKIYQKLKQFKVQFLVLQRKSDPSQVILQCLPSNKVCSCSLCFM